MYIYARKAEEVGEVKDEGEEDDGEEPGSAGPDGTYETLNFNTDTIKRASQARG